MYSFCDRCAAWAHGRVELVSQRGRFATTTFGRPMPRVETDSLVVADVVGAVAVWAEGLVRT